MKLAEARKDQDELDSLKAEPSKVQDKDVMEAMQSAESRKRDVEARLWGIRQFNMMIVYAGCCLQTILGYNRANIRLVKCIQSHAYHYRGVLDR